MYEFCPYCGKRLIWDDSNHDACGDLLFWYTTWSCTDCGVTIHETETYTKVKDEAEIDIIQEVK